MACCALTGAPGATPPTRRSSACPSSEHVLPAARRRVRDLLARWSEAVAPDDAPILRGAPRESVRGVESVIGDCGLYEDGRRVPGRLTLPRAGVSPTAGLSGSGCRTPRRRSSPPWLRQFELPPLAVGDAIKAHQRPKLKLRRHRLRRAQAVAVRRPARGRRRRRGGGVPRTGVLHLRSGTAKTTCYGGSAPSSMATPSLLRHGPTAVLCRAADLVVDGYEQAIACITVDIDDIESLFDGASRTTPSASTSSRRSPSSAGPSSRWRGRSALSRRGRSRESTPPPGPTSVTCTTTCSGLPTPSTGSTAC